MLEQRIRFRTMWQVLAVGQIALLLSASAFAAIRLLTSSANHWGFDCRWLWIACVVGVIWCGIGVVMKQARTSAVIALGLSALVVAAGVFVVDHCNLLVEYEEWLQRGMPAPWH